MSCPYILLPMIVLMELNIVLQTKNAAKQDTVPEVPAKKKDGIEVSAINMQQLLPLFLNYCRWDNNFNSFFN
jgi:hypothetical protein